MLSNGMVEFVFRTEQNCNADAAFDHPADKYENTANFVSHCFFHHGNSQNQGLRIRTRNFIIRKKSLKLGNRTTVQLLDSSQHYTVVLNLI